MNLCILASCAAIVLSFFGTVTGNEACTITVPYAANGVIEKTVEEGTVNCSWIIETKPSTFINFEFNYTVESSDGNCKSDYLYLKDVGMIRDLRLCGSEDNERYLVKSNRAIIRLVSDRFGNGFFLKWQELETDNCKIVQNKQYAIYTVHHKNPYGHAYNYVDTRLQNCDWWIETKPPGSSIDLIILHIFPEDCEVTSLQIRDKERLLENSCGIGSVIKTFNTDSLHVNLSGNEEYNSGVFVMSWKSHRGGNCALHRRARRRGRILQIDNEGNKDCSWKIKTIPGTFVLLDYFYHIPSMNNSCEDNYLYIADSEERDVFKLCGQGYSEKHTIKSNEVIVLYHSGDSVTESGFYLNWTASIPVHTCGKNIAQVSGQLVANTNRYPDEYVDCAWKITAPLGIEIDLVLDYTIETSSDNQCTADALQVDDESGKMIGKYCGYGKLGIKRIPGSEATIRFKADGSFYFWKLDVQWQPHYRNECAPMRKITENKIQYAKRKSRISVNKGTLMQVDDDASMNCAWKVESTPGHFIHFTYKYSVDKNFNCVDDFLKITDMDQEDVMSIPCDAAQGFGEITIKSNEAAIYFESGYSSYQVDSNSWFMLSWDEIPTKLCGRDVSGDYGTIAPDTYPEDYEEVVDCRWEIQSMAAESNIVVLFATDTEESDGCRADTLRIHDENGDLIGNFCGKHNELIEIEGNEVTVDFKTLRKPQDFYLFKPSTEYGFALAWQSANFTECTPLSEQARDRGMISQIDTKEGVNCTWTIKTEPEHYIHILVHYNIDDSDRNCTSSYLAISDSDGIDSIKRCGVQYKEEVNIKNDEAIVHFRTTGDGQTNGFILYWQSINVAACDEKISGEQGILFSEAETIFHQPVKICTWRIETPEDSDLYLIFNYRMPKSENCYKNSLQIFDENGLLINKYCGVGDQNIRMFARVAVVKFKIDYAEMSDYKSYFHMVWQGRSTNHLSIVETETPCNQQYIPGNPLCWRTSPTQVKSCVMKVAVSGNKNPHMIAYSVHLADQEDPSSEKEYYGLRGTTLNVDLFGCLEYKCSDYLVDTSNPADEPTVVTPLVVIHAGHNCRRTKVNKFLETYNQYHAEYIVSDEIQQSNDTIFQMYSPRMEDQLGKSFGIFNDILECEISRASPPAVSFHCDV